MITYMLFYISMNLGTFACIVSFGNIIWISEAKDKEVKGSKIRLKQILEA